MTGIGAAIDALIADAQRIAGLTRDGTRARHEAEMALISLRNLKRETDLWQEAQNGALGPAPVERPKLWLVPAGPPAPIDDPAFDV